MTLLGLTDENEQFPWAWIDARRDAALTCKDTLEFAPVAWREWVNRGTSALERHRRVVLRSPIAKKKEQLDIPRTDREQLGKLYDHYADKRHSFEGLASFVVSRVIGSRYQRGWVTKRSGDGGIDFVSSFEIGSGFESTPIVLLGQAKCIIPTSSINGRDLARLVARLRRGWVGAFVTTGCYSEAAQAELHQDEYPILLINGKTLMSELRREMAESGLSLSQVMHREDAWYTGHMRQAEPGRILIEGPSA